VAEFLAAISYGERLAAARAARNAELAPDRKRRELQENVAMVEAERARLIEARLTELGSIDLEDRFRPFFDAVFEGTEPSDWLEAQAWHYIGDALVRDLADALVPTLDPVSAEVTTAVLADRDEQESFALDEVALGLQSDPGATERVAAYARRVIGEALTQTRRALDASDAVRSLLGGEEGEKRMLLDVLQRHRERLDRLGIERVD
jgi:hypothetical protein